VSNFQSSLDTLQRLQAEGGRLSSWISETTSNNEIPDLVTLLALPVNHIPTYEKLLEVLVEATPVDTPEYEKSNQAFTTIQQTSTFIKQNLSMAKNHASIHEVER
jgi:hypothetical protein